MIHIYPLNDDKEHNLTGTQCHCESRVEFTDPFNGESYAEGLVIHNAFDFREVKEYFKQSPMLVEVMCPICKGSADMDIDCYGVICPTCKSRSINRRVE